MGSVISDEDSRICMPSSAASLFCRSWSYSFIHMSGTSRTWVADLADWLVDLMYACILLSSAKGFDSIRAQSSCTSSVQSSSEMEAVMIRYGRKYICGKNQECLTSNGYLLTGVQCFGTDILQLYDRVSYGPGLGLRNLPIGSVDVCMWQPSVLSYSIVEWNAMLVSVVAGLIDMSDWVSGLGESWVWVE